MSVATQSNILGVLVGANPSPISTATVQITDSSATATYIADGQIVMLDYLDSPLQPVNANIANSPFVRFVQRSGSDLHFSNRLRGIDLLKVTGVTYTAGQEQIYALGYNGTSGSLDTSVSNQYIFTIVNTWDSQFWSEQQNRDAYNIVLQTNTQSNLAQSLSFQVNFAMSKRTSNGTGATVKAEMLADGTTDATSGTPTMSVVNGSNIFTLSATNTAVQTIGAVIRIGATAATTTGPVYVVIATPTTDSSLTANQVRVHTLYQGATATLTLGTSAYVVTGSANFGVKFTGLPLTWGIPPYSDFKYKRVQFHFDLINFGASTLTKSQESKLGNGDYRLVSELEYFAQGNEGALNRTVIPLPTGRHDTVTGATYDTIVLEWADRQRINTVAGQVPMRQQLFIFMPDGATQETLVLNQLNPYIASAGLATISL